MSKRLSTAQILAAARAADGDKSVGQASSPVTATNGRPAEGQARADEPDTVADVAADVSATGAGASDRVPSVGTGDSAPTSVVAMLEAVRGNSDSIAPTSADGAVRPPDVRGLINQVRVATGRQTRESVGEMPPDPTRPRSIASILSAIRHSPPNEGKPSVSPQDSSSQSVAKNREPGPAAAAKRGKMSTAEILAAARKLGGAGGDGKATATGSSVEALPGSGASRTAAILAAARKQAGVSGEKAPTGPKKSAGAGGASKTASILAAARKQGGGGGSSPAVPAGGGTDSAKRELVKRGVATKPAAKSVSKVGDSDSADGRPRPARISEILAAIRCVSEEQSAPSELPSLAVMLSALREASAGAPTRSVADEETAGDWKSRLRRWWESRDSTHHGASI